MALEIVTQCRECPMFNSSDVCERCRHPKGASRRIEYEEMDTIPTWCPLRQDSLTVALAGKEDDHG